MPREVSVNGLCDKETSCGEMVEYISGIYLCTECRPYVSKPGSKELCVWWVERYQMIWRNQKIQGLECINLIIIERVISSA